MFEGGCDSRWSNLPRHYWNAGDECFSPGLSTTKHIVYAPDALARIKSHSRKTLARVDQVRDFTDQVYLLYRAFVVARRASSEADDLAQWQTIPGEAPSSQGTQLAMLLDSRARNERPLVSGPEVRRSTEFATCLYKAAFTGQPVQRGSVTPDDPFYHHVEGKGPARGAT